MLPIAELEAENKQIEDLRMVLSILISHSDLRTNSVFCDLLNRFHESLENHLTHEARALYPEMLKHRDHDLNQVAERFLDNTHQLERILSGYSRRWCRNIHAGDRDHFIDETKEIFRLVNERLHLESDRLFPALAGALA